MSELFPIITTISATLVFWLIGYQLTKNQPFELGRGHYAGAFPLIGALCGAAFSHNAVHAVLPVATGTVFLAIIGFLRDRFRVKYATLLPIVILIVSATIFANLPGTGSGLRIVSGVLWAVLIIVCLKISALVYEMPFILLATTSLSQFVIFSTGEHSPHLIAVNTAIMITAILMLLYSATGRRVIQGSSGLFAAGFLLAAVSLVEGPQQLLFFGLFIPSMVIFFPFALICTMIIVSYFGNRLHRPNPGTDRQWTWTLRREKTVVFSGLIFLCLNFFGLLVTVDAPAFGYFALFLLLVSALAGFTGAFARRTETNAPAPFKIEMLGISIDAVTPTQVLDRIAGYLKTENAGLMHIITADSLALVRASEEERFKTVMQRAEMVVPDGAGIVWASDFLGKPLRGRVPGVALVSQICDRAAETGWKIYCIGGRPGIAEQAVQTLNTHGKINFCGVRHGFFAADSAEEETIMKEIAAAGPDIIFVALGVPRQEWFISRLRGYLDHGIAIGIGGSFDVISQTLPRAPVWMQQCGIEWLFRLWLEPFRFMRMLKIPVFVLQILRHKWNQPET